MSFTSTHVYRRHLTTKEISAEIDVIKQNYNFKTARIYPVLPKQMKLTLDSPGSNSVD